jgi:hypothetical protein
MHFAASKSLIMRKTKSENARVLRCHRITWNSIMPNQFDTGQKRMESLPSHSTHGTWEKKSELPVTMWH